MGLTWEIAANLNLGNTFGPNSLGGPALPWRQALRENDLRNWIPTAPVLLCGGDGGELAVAEAYHAMLVAPICFAATRSFFAGQ
jgi:hypothetical protein